MTPPPRGFPTSEFPGGDVMEVGRLGMQLTEWPSIIPQEHTDLVPGLVLTSEPFVIVGPDKMLVHEENIVIRDGAPEALSSLQSRDMRVI